MARLCFCYTSSQLNYQDCDHSWNSIIEQQHRREERLQPYMARLCFSYTSSQLNYQDCEHSWSIIEQSQRRGAYFV